MIDLKTPREIKKLRTSNLIVAEILSRLKEKAKPGVATIELEHLAEKLLVKKGAVSAFKNYQGYPNCLCTSINEEVIHGIPSKRVLQEGDILSLDFGVLYQGYYGDAAISVAIGSVSQEAQRLMDTTEEALYQAIDKARVGNRLSDISAAVESYVVKRGFSVVRDFVGHGIGRKLHEEPQIPNFGPPGMGVRLKVGMVLAIEPMINAGKSDVTILDDGWCAVTKDKSLSAHFEHSVAITDNGPFILSKP
jgi:methionyl aminopeptidase